MLIIMRMAQGRAWSADITSELPATSSTTQFEAGKPSGNSETYTEKSTPV